ncbi:MAG: hypothetical protein ACE5GD_10275 [Candidatus Geothermarchaeales archaeon]
MGVELGEYTNVIIKQEVYEEIKRYYEAYKNELLKEGVNSVTGLFVKAVYEYLKRFDRYEHLNTYEDRVIIRDIASGRIINIELRDKRLYCEHCEAFNCDHVRYTKYLSEVRKFFSQW